MQSYQALIQDVLEYGELKTSDQGLEVYSIFGRQLRFDLHVSFPLLNPEAVDFSAVVHELLWRLAGKTNIQSLQAEGVDKWDQWADAAGELGPVEGKQWRNWQTKQGETIDQIGQLIAHIQDNPTSRRHILMNWNPADLDEMAVVPHQALCQFYVVNGKLSCQLYQRVCDIVTELPSSVATYALLTYLVAAQCNLVAAEFVWTSGDTHIAQQNLAVAKALLMKKAEQLPQLCLAERPDIFAYHFADIQLKFN